jgi:CRISPR-associated exonuclease Cas4
LKPYLDCAPMAKRDSGRFISAGDLEKYSYCHLSWWLSREHDPDSDELKKGIHEHGKFGKSLWEIDSKERSARQSEKLVFWYAVTATMIAILGVELLIEADSLPISEIMGVVALIWILAAAFFLYKASTSTITSKLLDYEKTILIFAIVAVVIAINAVGFLLKDDRLAQALEMVSIVWLIAASYFLYRSLRSTSVAHVLRREFKLKGKIEYIDVDDSKVFKSEMHGITGRPDYVVKLGDQLVPVEVKKGRTPQGPLFSHIIQVTAYCLLLEDSSGRAPPYGIIRYPNHEFQIDYNDDMRKMLLEKVDGMRKALISKDVHRNHNRPGKCRSCSRKSVCPEKLS